MKTAQIHIYHIFGTAREHSADVFYRGKMIRSYMGCTPSELIDKATDWAHANGFTRCKVSHV